MTQTYEITPIGTISTPFKTLDGMPIQPTGASDVIGTVILNKDYTNGLKDLDGFSHIILLYFFHKSDGFDLMVKPFLDDTKRGLFSTRAPRRPNSIGLSIVKLLEINDNRLTIKGIDVLDKTPLVDIKPYVPEFDTHENIRAGWLEKAQYHAGKMKSDNRFIKKG